MIGSFLGAWLLFPLVLLVAGLGCGLLVRRAAGGALPGVLLVPVGFALVLVICAFATSYGWLAPAAGPIVVVFAATGVALELRTLRSRRPQLRGGGWVWPALAALAAFTAVGGPVFLTGNVSWAGYTRIVDLAFQFDFAQHLADAGRVSPPHQDSSYNIVTTKLLAIGYPGGAQATLGVMAKLVRVNVAWCYQAFLAVVAAMGALAVYSALGRVTRNGLMRCGGAALSIQPNLLYAYSLEAGIKELATAALLLLVVATLLEWLPGGAQPSGARAGRLAAIPVAVASSAAFGAFSLGIAPWLALLLAGAFAISLASGSGRRRRLVESWALFVIVAIAISAPGLVTAGKLATVAGSAVGGVVDLGLGNLAAPVSRWSSAGVWLTGDYRYPIAHTTASHVFDVIILALAALGVLASLVRRRWIIALLGLTPPIALFYFVEHSTAWIQFKAFTITAAFAVMLAFAGAALIQTSARAWLSRLGWLAAAAVAAGVLYGNALIYHDTSLAPGARYHELAAIASRYSGHGPALDPYFDEYAEYFLRGELGSTIVDPANLRFQVRPGIPLPSGMSFGWDLNQLVSSFLQSFPLIIQPRSPVATRAPSNYDLVEETRFFDVWRRDRPPQTVLEHFPLSSLPHERTPALCRTLAAAARRAGPHALLAYALSSAAAVANPLQGHHPDYWRPLGPGALAAYGAGSAEMHFTISDPGRFRMWLAGSVGRPLGVLIDGRRASGIGYEERYPDQFLLLGSVQLGAGGHTIALVRAGGDLHPGSGDAPVETVSRTIGTVVFDREDANVNRTYVAPASAMARVCAAPVGYEWLELLAPGGAAPGSLPAKT